MSIWDEAMRLALDEARAACARGDVPIGAVVLDEAGRVVSRAGNERVLSGDPLAHAEVLALRRAADELGGWRLDGCTLVVTLEPCAMCAGALVQARVARLVYGAVDAKAGAVASLWDVVRDPRLPHRPDVVGGILADDCAAVLARFFQQRRGCRPIASGDRKGTSAVKDLEAAYAEWDASDDAVLWDSASNDGIADA